MYDFYIDKEIDMNDYIRYVPKINDYIDII